MNLPNKTNGLAGENFFAAATTGIFRQTPRHGLFYLRLKMQPPAHAVRTARRFLLALLCLMVFRAEAQTNYYSPNGTEYAIVGALPGEQVSPSVAVSTNGGYLVWADNITDGDNWGISARKLDATLSGVSGTFRVNVTGAGAQENPRVALLQNGGAVFVWQGGTPGFQHIYARFTDANGIFTGGSDILVTSSANYTQMNPSVAVLNNGNVVVVWQSKKQVSASSMLDVYGQILTATGLKVGSEFPVNQFTAYNQRTPAVAAQPNGGFIVTWVSEQQRTLAPTNTPTVSVTSYVAPSIDIYSRYFNATGAALGNEFLVNADNNPCSNPSLAVATDGSYLVTWTARDAGNVTNGLDIYARPYSSAGVAGSVVLVNGRIYGDEYLSKVAAIGLDFLVTWTSLGQDGSREGVYGRYLHNNGAFNSAEFRVNTTTASQQMDPCVAGDGNGQFLVVWRSFTGFANGFDLYAQRYLNLQIGLPAMSAPFVRAPFTVVGNAYQPKLLVTWATLSGLSVSSYEVYADNGSTPAGIVTSNEWTMTSNNVPAIPLLANSTHSFKVDYVLADGRRSPQSPAASGTTWQGYNWGGVPLEWMQQYYGYNLAAWPSATSVIPGSSYTVQQVFLTGGNPLDPNTWLKQTMATTGQGIFLNWNTTPGATYQVITTTNLTVWGNYGAARFAPGTSDSINVGGNSKGYYRIVLLR
jgi:hypothetical protein